MRCKQCNDELAITERYYCNRCHGWLIESAPAQEEKEMITCKHGERNDDESCWNCKNENEDLAAELRQLHREAALAALSGTAVSYSFIMTNMDARTVAGNATHIADEFVRQYNPDAVIAEVVG